MKYLSFLLIAFLFVIISSCNTTEPPVDDSIISLFVEDVSCTEAWLKLSTHNLGLPASVTVEVNETANRAFYLQSNDTIIYIDSLSPSQNYTFQAVTIKEKQPVASRETFARTLDTTSHNFTWKTWTFGDFASSYFSDVAIIDENNIWAVGEIYLYDSLGNIDPHPYNLAIFDGSEWELKRIPFIYEGSEFYGPIYSIFAFNKNDIWLGIGSMIHWNGSQFNSIKIPDETFPSRVNAIWGTSSEDLYIVGNNGNIAHYNGRKWIKIESGTAVSINDIWGSININTGKSLILCAASNTFQLGESKILRIDEEKEIDSIIWRTDRRIHSLWFENKLKVYASGGGVFFGSNNIGWEEQTELPDIFTRRIRGNAKNDLFVVGDFGLIAHFNGNKWKVYSEAAVALFYSADYSDKGMAAVGQRNNEGVILVMKK